MWKRSVVLVSLVASLGLADERPPLPLELRWQAPAQCGDAATVLAEVQSMLSGTALRTERQKIEVDVVVLRARNGELEIRLVAAASSSTGGRRLVVSDCAEAVHATALLLALMVSPQQSARDTGEPAVKSEPVSAGSPVPKATAPPQPVPKAAETVVTSPARPKRLWFSGIRAALDHGSLPKNVVGAGMRFGLRHKSLSIELSPAVWWPARAASSQLVTAGGDFSLYDLALLGCYRGVLGGGLSADSCLGIDVARLNGKGFGSTETWAAGGTYLSLVTELRLALELSDAWSWHLGASLANSPKRPTFAIRELGAVHQPAAWSERLFIGIERAF